MKRRWNIKDLEELVKKTREMLDLWEEKYKESGSTNVSKKDIDETEKAYNTLNELLKHEKEKSKHVS